MSCQLYFETHDAPIGSRRGPQGGPGQHRGGAIEKRPAVDGIFRLVKDRIPCWLRSGNILHQLEKQQATNAESR
jgi:hypothetical protein